MSLDELVSLRRATEKKDGKKTTPGQKRRQPKRRAKSTSAMEIDKGAVQQTSNRMKRQNQIAKRRGLATKSETSAETQRRAQKAVKAKTTTATTTVTLKGKKKKKQTRETVPKTFSIAPTATSRPVSIKDFTLPKDTKMTISFTSEKAPPKSITLGTDAKPKTNGKKTRARRPAAKK